MKEFLIHRGDILFLAIMIPVWLLVLFPMVLPWQAQRLRWTWRTRQIDRAHRRRQRRRATRSLMQVLARHRGWCGW